MAAFRKPSEGPEDGRIKGFGRGSDDANWRPPEVGLAGSGEAFTGGLNLDDIQVIPLGRTRYRLKHPKGMVDCDWAIDKLGPALAQLKKVVDA